MIDDDDRILEEYRLLALRRTATESALLAANRALADAGEGAAPPEELDRLRAVLNDARDADYTAYRDELAAHGDSADNSELQVAFEAGRNWVALLTALRRSYGRQAHWRDQPFQTADDAPMFFVPQWVLYACCDLVSRQLLGTDHHAMGRHARFVTRLRDELKDQRRWVVVRWCQDRGITAEEARGAASEYFSEPEKTIEHALGRVEARRRHAAEHAAHVGVKDGAVSLLASLFRTSDPDGDDALDDLIDEETEDEPWFFAAWMRAIENLKRPISADSTDALRAAALIRTVDAIRSRRAEKGTP